MIALALFLPASPPVANAVHPHLTYGGGPVLDAPKVYMDYWGWVGGVASDPDGAEAYLAGFWQGVGGSDWAGVYTQYTGPQGEHITNPTGQFGGSWHDDSLSPPPVDTVVGAPSPGDFILQEAVAAEQHFGYDANGLYFLALPHGSAVSFAGGYCAYHSATKDPQGRTFAYALLPYVSDFPTVNNSVTTADCGVDIIANSPHPRLDAFSIVAGHEYMEAVTDPQPASGWYDPNNGENADICAFVFTGPGAHTQIHLSTGDYGVQSTWSNQNDQCANTLNIPVPPPPPSVQTKDYKGPVGSANNCIPNCMTFDVPPGSTHVHLAMVDMVSPHAVGYYCVGSCGGAKGYFCDGITLAVPASAQQVVVVVDNFGMGIATCGATNPAVTIEGTVTATFS